MMLKPKCNAYCHTRQVPENPSVQYIATNVNRPCKEDKVSARARLDHGGFRHCVCCFGFHTGQSCFVSLGNLEPGSVAFARRQGSAQALPTPYEHWKGDLDGMIKRQQVRALVVYSRTTFFYDQGRPEGISYEALQEFQGTLNQCQWKI